MKFIDRNKKNHPAKMNMIALFFAIIAIAGVFLSVRDMNQPEDKKEQVEKLKAIAQDTTIKNINIEYKESDSGKFSNESKLPSTTGYTKKFFQSMLTVLALLFLILIVVYIFKKKNNLNFNNATNIKIIDRKYLGQKQYLATVLVDDEKLLLGITDHSINLIKTLDTDVENEDVNKNFSEPQSETFPKILGKIRKK
ncbi:MAG: flagellar biosynthetic protein FliO [Fidelibacterota bacterium]